MNRIYELTDLIDKDLEENLLSDTEKEKIASELNGLLPAGSLVLAQINPVSGYVEYNAKKAAKWIEWANRLNVDAVVFPEMYLIGYPIGDFIDRFPVVAEENIEWLEALARLTKSVKVIIGFVEINKEKTGKNFISGSTERNPHTGIKPASYSRTKETQALSEGTIPKKADQQTGPLFKIFRTSCSFQAKNLRKTRYQGMGKTLL